MSSEESICIYYRVSAEAAPLLQLVALAPRSRIAVPLSKTMNTAHPQVPFSLGSPSALKMAMVLMFIIN